MQIRFTPFIVKMVNKQIDRLKSGTISNLDIIVVVCNRPCNCQLGPGFQIGQHNDVLQSIIIMTTVHAHLFTQFNHFTDVSQQPRNKLLLLIHDGIDLYIHIGHYGHTFVLKTFIQYYEV